MNVFKTIGKFFTKSLGANQTGAIPLTEHDTGLYQLIGNDYRFGTQSKDFLLQAYGMNPYVFMVVDRIVQRMVRIDKRLLSLRTDEEIEDPVLQELLSQPNEKEDGNAFLYRVAATYLVAGEVFVIREQEPGEPDQYICPINYNVIINQDTKGRVLSYWVTQFGESKTYLPNEVLHIAKPDITLDTNHGFSTLRALRKTWESNNEVWASEAALHKNKGIAGVLYSDGNRPMTDKEQDDLQDDYDKKYMGIQGFGKVKISTSKLGYIQMGMNPTDLQSIETRIEHLRTICAAYNVDSKLFGDPAASTYNNMAEAKKAFITDAVLPLSNFILPQLIGFMARSVFRTDYTMELVTEGVEELQIVMEQRSARLGREVAQGLISPRDAQAMLYPEMQEEDETINDVRTTAAVTANDILQIQQSLVSETITREGAIAILVNLYGFDDATANQILG